MFRGGWSDFCSGSFFVRCGPDVYVDHSLLRKAHMLTFFFRVAITPGNMGTVSDFLPSRSFGSSANENVLEMVADPHYPSNL